MSLARRLAGDAFVYGLGAAVLPLLGLVSLPVVARALSTAQYGILELATTTVYLAVLAADLGLSSAMARSFLARPPEDRRGRTEIASTAMTTVVGVAVLMAGLALALGRSIAGGDLKGEGELVIVLAAVTIPLTCAANLTRETMRLRFRPWDYLTSSLLGSVLAVGLTIPAVTLFDLGVEGVLAAGAIGMAAAALFGIAKAWSLIWSGLSRAHLREMLTYGLPLVPGLLSIWAMAYADRIILAVSAGSDDVGLYAIANRVAQPISLLATAIAVAYHPLMLDVARDRPDDERRLRRQVATGTLILGLGISVILVALGPEIVRVVAPGYEDATESIGPLAVGLTLYALVSILVGSFLLLRRTALTAAFTVLAGAANVLLCIVLVPTLGAFGAALGTAGGYALLAGSYLWFGLRHDPEAHDPRRLGQVFAIGVATIGVAGILSETTDGPMSFLARLGCVVIFAAALLAFRVVTPSLLSALARLVRNPQG